MILKKSIKIKKGLFKPFYAGLVIEFSTKAQGVAFILQFLNSDIDWKYSVEEKFYERKYKVTIFFLPWGDNLKELNEILIELDGSKYYE